MSKYFPSALLSEDDISIVYRGTSLNRMIYYIVFIDFFAVPTSDIQKDIDQYFF